VKRRKFVSLVGAAAGAVPFVIDRAKAEALSPAPAAPTSRGKSTMTVGCQRAPTDAKMLSYFKRHAVDHICGYPDPKAPDGYAVDSLKRLRELCEANGVALDMVQFPLMSSSSIARAQDDKAIMLGKEPDRQRDIDQACEIIKNCAAAGIPAIKYNMNLLGVLRNGTTPGRGGVKYSTWKLANETDQSLTPAGAVNADLMWERITYFLERVVPVAAEHKIRLACHPHDPGVPASGYRGIVRVLGTPDGLKKFVAVKENPYHGLNLCLGTVAEMLQDPNKEIHDVIRYFGTRGKIFNIHFRNIKGKRDDFYETFPDEGDMNMAQVMRTLHEVGYQYMVMPDHMPRHEDDKDQHQAFAFGYGYIRALIQTVQQDARQQETRA
jgi:mannonate dehydratase